MESDKAKQTVKIAVVGDTHGRIEAITRELKKIAINHFIFTGDFYSDAKRISHHAQTSFDGVLGNCDPYDHNLHEELFLEIADKKIYIVHGHQYNVKRDLHRLFYRAQELGAHIVIYGHTHMANCEYIEDILFINPGSPSRPRGGSEATYILLEIGENILKPEIILID
ncbi:MAG TPA: metallophosphoesterase [Syntrophomonadaceae bacterium]|nr:metallophosphoesterase [Syntrophomonadaceae bacterium]